MDVIHYCQEILFSEIVMRNYVFVIIFSWCLNAESWLTESNEAVIQSHEYSFLPCQYHSTIASYLSVTCFRTLAVDSIIK